MLADAAAAEISLDAGAAIASAVFRALWLATMRRRAQPPLLRYIIDADD